MSICYYPNFQYNGILKRSSHIIQIMGLCRVLWILATTESNTDVSSRMNWKCKMKRNSLKFISILHIALQKKTKPKQNKPTETHQAGNASYLPGPPRSCSRQKSKAKPFSQGMEEQATSGSTSFRSTTSLVKGWDSPKVFICNPMNETSCPHRKTQLAVRLGERVEKPVLPCSAALPSLPKRGNV